MIRIHAFVFVALLELLVVFVALWLLWFFKARTLNRRLAALRSTAADEPVDHEAAYFAKQLAATRAQIDLLAKGGPDVPLSGLRLRLDYLNLEHDFAQNRQRDAEFWIGVQERIDALRIAHAPSAPADTVAASVASQAAEGDEADDPQKDPPTAATRASVIEEFRTALAALLADQQQQSPEMLVHADRLMRCSRELAMCMSILEDDNTFLREQLKAAVVTHDT
jgi:hypothetical protein